MTYFEHLDRHAPKHDAFAAVYWRTQCKALLEIGLPKLTARQHSCLLAIKTYIDQKGEPPTYRDIGAIMGVCTESVGAFLNKLEDRGYISRVPGQARSISVHEFPPSRLGN
jgi:DNA-binding MarR family transcriptional regulator